MRKISYRFAIGLLALIASPGSAPADQAPVVTQILLTTNRVVLRGTNGAPNSAYELLASPDLSTPLNEWVALATNTFEADGKFDCTNPISPGQAAQFYLLFTGGSVSNTTPDFGLYGFATVDGTTVGGQGGTTQTVATASAFTNAVQANGKAVIYVQGTLTIGEVRPKSNKTIIGLGTNATLRGVLVLGSSSAFGQVSNIIIRNLFITNPTGVGTSDGISLQYGPHHIWVDHCTFYDNPDGQMDTTHAADCLTYSWNRFYYTRDNGHNFVNLVGHDDGNGAEDTGTLRITWHHNWYSTMCMERMPRVRFGQNHVYNNYYGCTGNNYCIGVGCSSQILLESSYFDNVSEPWRNYSSSCVQGLIHWNSDNVFASTTVPTWAPNSTVFTPPYTYLMDPGASVKSNVMTWAGAGVIQP